MTNPSMKQIKQWKIPSAWSMERPATSLLLSELRYCRKLVQTQSTYCTAGICRYTRDTKAGRYLRRYIMAQLRNGPAPAVFLSSWIGNRPKFRKWNNAEGWQKARLMWIDWMIASLEGREYVPV